MTSLAFITGVVPLVLGSGAGAEMRHAMGIAVFSGMLGVTFFGLFLTPVFYVLLRSRPRARAAKQPRWAGRAHAEAAAEATGDAIWHARRRSLLTGCASMAPPYERPAAPVAAAFPDCRPPAQPAALPAGRDREWQRFFVDPAR